MRPHNIGAVWLLSTTLTRMAYRGVTKHPSRNVRRIQAHKKQSRFSLELEILSLTIAADTSLVFGIDEKNERLKRLKLSRQQ